jgi:ADP-ribose pyrophosphatase YjhB (NUDIX family)
MREAVIAVVLHNKNGVLLGWHNDREEWQIPNGISLNGNSLKECCQKSVVDHTGMLVEYDDFIGIGFEEFREDFVLLYYAAKIPYDQKPKPMTAKWREWRYFKDTLPEPTQHNSRKAIEIFRNE